MRAEEFIGSSVKTVADLSLLFTLVLAGPQSGRPVKARLGERREQFRGILQFQAENPPECPK